jgi:O-antigen ligase/polysaccharide polymerase Wzy-like membrane protein
MASHSAPASTSALSGPSIAVERLRILLLWLTGASSAIVFIEPSPYELVSLLTIIVFALSGLTLSPTLMPPAFLLMLINIGYSVSASAVIGEQGVITWLMTSWYLALTAVFFAAMLGANTQARLDALTRGCIVAGIIASLVAIVGYFRIFPSADELLLLYDRARGTFKDPNVLGAFLVFPTLLVLQRLITGNASQAARSAILLGLFAVALLLSFSRAAWGQVVYTAVVALALTFLTSRSEPLRLRIVLLTIAGAAVLVIFIISLVSIDTVAVMFKERTGLQTYDVNEQGRFARHAMGAIFALDRPLGIGPLQFNKYFTEDPHNSYLNAFMAGGWLAGACYPALVTLTLFYGLRCALTRTPWQSTAIIVYAGYFGIVTESVIIDSDHWRHAFLLLGLLWGLIAATRRHVARANARDGGQPWAPNRAALARQERPA